MGFIVCEYNTDLVLAYVAYETEIHGYIKKDPFTDKKASCDFVLEYLEDPYFPREFFIDSSIHKRVISYKEFILNAIASDFIMKIRDLLSKPTISSSYINMIASSFYGFDNTNKMKTLSNSEFLGNIGSDISTEFKSWKLVKNGLNKYSRPFFLYNINLVSGVNLLFFSNSDCTKYLDKYSCIKGIISKHNLYYDLKQTYISNVTFYGRRD